jgi:hypothetical protein
LIILTVLLPSGRALGQSNLGSPVATKAATKEEAATVPSQPGAPQDRRVTLSAVSQKPDAPGSQTAQPPRIDSSRQGGPEAYVPSIRLDVPGPQALFRLESEAELRERMRQEARQREEGKQLYFPDERIVLTSEKTPAARLWPPLAEVVEPTAVGFRKLYFHQINFERYGWSLGIFQPAISTGLFYFDFLTMPLQIAVNPCRCYEYNSGWCLPGDPVPFALYPPHPK